MVPGLLAHLTRRLAVAVRALCCVVTRKGARVQPDGYDGGSGGAKKGGSRRRGSGGASPRADATSEGAELLLARKKRRETIQGREAKQYVDRFLEDEARREALSVQNLAQTAGERVAALEEVFSVRMTTLTERIRSSMMMSTERSSDPSESGSSRLRHARHALIDMMYAYAQ